jgi:hypothetical protein
MRSRRRRIPILARQSLGLAVAVPEVVAHRLTRMWLAGSTPSRRDQQEMLRMCTEKVAAFYESWAAMYMEMWRASLAFAFAPWSSAHARRTYSRTLRAGIAPIHRRAVSNAKRLRGKRW